MRSASARWARAVFAAAALLVGCGRAGAPRADASLVFAREGKAQRTLTTAEMAAIAPAVTVTTHDPYYGREKRFRALPLSKLIEAAFGHVQQDAQFVLRARDGYAVPIEARVLLEGEGAFVAFEDLDGRGFEPIGPQRADPAPYYLVWRGEGQRSLETHPRPWQLAQVDLTRFELVYPHTEPRGAAEGSPERRGYALFRGLCIRCHAINREGGRVGPDLNVPQSILAYRPEAQVRAYIRDPRQFRYGNMPPHPGLGDADLDALIAYLGAMGKLQHDPDAGKAAHP